MDNALQLKGIIEKAYRLDDLTCRLISQGVNEVYAIETRSSKYIFKIYLHQELLLEDIQGEIELLHILHIGGVKVCNAICDDKNNKIQILNTITGIKYGVLFNFAAGDVEYNLDEKKLILVGNELAKLHSITQNLHLKNERLKIDIHFILTSTILKLKQAFVDMEDDYEFLLQSAALVVVKYQKVDMSNFGYGYCHNDFLPHNFHFAEDGAIRIFDFELYSQGFLINDLASFYIHCYLQMMFGRINHSQLKENFNIFLQSYRMIKSISPEELAIIPYVGFARWILLIDMDLQRSDIPIYPDYLKDQIIFIKKWVELYIL